MSLSRSEQARINGAKSRGPKTVEGKQRSRLSSLKHGLTSSTLVVLPEEHQHEYDEILAGFRESLQPQGSVEDALVLRLAQAHWRSLRARRIETGMLNTAAAVQRNAAREHVENCPEHLDVHNAIGVGFLRMPPEQWQTYLRYDAAIARDFFRTLDTLTKLQRLRQNAKPAPAPVSQPEPKPAPKPVLVRTAGAGTTPALSGPDLGFVSQPEQSSLPYNRLRSKQSANSDPSPSHDSIISPADPHPSRRP
jgi:hypothetical protein